MTRRPEHAINRYPQTYHLADTARLKYGAALTTYCRARTVACVHARPSRQRAWRAAMRVSRITPSLIGGHGKAGAPVVIQTSTTPDPALWTLPRAHSRCYGGNR